METDRQTDRGRERDRQTETERQRPVDRETDRQGESLQPEQLVRVDQIESYNLHRFIEHFEGY